MRPDRITKWSAVFLFTAATLSEGQVRPSALLVPAHALAEDVSILRRAMETLHPGLYRNVPRPRVDALFDDLARDLDHQQSVADVFVRLSRFTAELRCGHTYPNYWNQSKALRADLMEGPDKLPFTYRILGGRMFVDRSVPGAADIRRGDEILTISGARVSQVIGTLASLVRADGDNEIKRISLAELRGIKLYEAADAFIPLLFPPAREVRGTQSYLLTLRRKGTVHLVTARAMRAAERNISAVPAHTQLPRAEPWSWQVKGTVGILRTDQFVGKDVSGKHPWREFLDRTFAAARADRLTGIVIDLRENEGGLDEDALLLLTYLSRKPIPPLAVTQLTSYETVPTDLRPYLQTWDPAFFDRRGHVAPLHDGGFLRLDGRAPGGEALAPSDLAFAGKVVLLVGPVASSASHWLTQRAAHARIATIVGEPTGGSLRGTSGGELFFLRLPNTGVEIDIPLIATWVAGTQSATGVVPDVPVAPTAADFIAGRDPAMIRAIREARNHVR